MTKPVYTPEQLERNTHILLAALGIDGLVFVGANVLDHFGDAFTGIALGAGILSVVAGFAITLLLLLNLIARALISRR